jgi:hypothetical protein
VGFTQREGTPRYFSVNREKSGAHWDPEINTLLLPTATSKHKKVETRCSQDRAQALLPEEEQEGPALVPGPALWTFQQRCILTSSTQNGREKNKTVTSDMLAPCKVEENCSFTQN